MEIPVPLPPTPPLPPTTPSLLLPATSAPSSPAPSSFSLFSQHSPRTHPLPAPAVSPLSLLLLLHSIPLSPHYPLLLSLIHPQTSPLPTLVPSPPLPQAFPDFRSG